MNSNRALIIKLNVLKMDSNILEDRILKLAMELNVSEFEQSVNYRVMHIESGFEYIRASIIKISNGIKYE